MSQDLINEFSELMLQLRQAMNQHSALSIEERIGSGLQLAALHWLHGRKLANVSELSNNLHISLSSATQLVERLVKAGFMERTPGVEDRRVTNLSLTREGAVELRRQEKHVKQKMQSILERLSEEDREQLVRILRNLVAALVA